MELERKGDRDAFQALAASVVDRLFATAVLILRDHSMADDATQETIVRAWRDLPSLRDPDRPLSTGSRSSSRTGAEA